MDPGGSGRRGRPLGTGGPLGGWEGEPGAGPRLGAGQVPPFNLFLAFTGEPTNGRARWGAARGAAQPLVPALSRGWDRETAPLHRDQPPKTTCRASPGPVVPVS